MGTKCCWKENKDNSENQNVNVNKPSGRKQTGKDNHKKDVNPKRKSFPLRSITEISIPNKKNKEEIKKDIDVQDKRSSTASFHSASSCNDTLNTSSSNNNNILSDKYQG